MNSPGESQGSEKSEKLDHFKLSDQEVSLGAQKLHILKETKKKIRVN